MLPDHLLPILYDEACRQRAIDVNMMKGIFGKSEDLEDAFRIHGKRTFGYYDKQFDQLKELLGNGA